MGKKFCRANFDLGPIFKTAKFFVKKAPKIHACQLNMKFGQVIGKNSWKNMSRSDFSNLDINWSLLAKNGLFWLKMAKIRIFCHQWGISGRINWNFCNINLYWKSSISAIPDRTQTRISRARNWILTFLKKRWLRIEKLFHINSTCIFTPLPPYRLKLQ